MPGKRERRPVRGLPEKSAAAKQQKVRDTEQMEKLKNCMQRHRRAIGVLAFGFVVWINCCGFPIYNLNKEWPFPLVALNVYAVLVSAVMVGRMLRWAFDKAKVRLVALLLGAFTGVGLACRFLLEYGEVSNTYNFTAANAVLHVAVFWAVAFFAWFAGEEVV